MHFDKSWIRLSGNAATAITVHLKVTNPVLEIISYVV